MNKKQFFDLLNEDYYGSFSDQQDLKQVFLQEFLRQDGIKDFEKCADEILANPKAVEKQDVFDTHNLGLQYILTDPHALAQAWAIQSAKNLGLEPILQLMPYGHDSDNGILDFCVYVPLDINSEIAYTVCQSERMSKLSGFDPPKRKNPRYIKCEFKEKPEWLEKPTAEKLKRLEGRVARIEYLYGNQRPEFTLPDISLLDMELITGDDGAIRKAALDILEKFPKGGATALYDSTKNLVIAGLRATRLDDYSHLKVVPFTISGDLNKRKYSIFDWYEKDDRSSVVLKLHIRKPEDIAVPKTLFHEG